MPNSVAGILWAIFLVLGNGFFVGAEFALISARRAQIEPLAEAGSLQARTTIRAMEKVPLLLAASQIGVTICSLLLLVIAEPAIHELLAPALHLTGWGEAVESGVAFALTLTLVSFLHVVLGEMIPKQISFAVPERAALILVPMLFGFARVLTPLVYFLNSAANLVLKSVGIKPKDEANSAFTLDQVEDIVEHSTREGVLSDSSGTISNTFEFTEKKVSQVAVAVDQLVIFDYQVTPREIEQAVAKHGFSRYVLRSVDGEITGYLHLKDVIDLRLDEADRPVPAKRIRSLLSLPASMELEDALASMKRVQAHVAKAFDSQGNITGVLFLEDIIEELVGEVDDITRR
jgi:CBS domain containing-hemolysin-like protein